MAYGRILPNFREFSQMLLTFSLVVVGWIIFRSQSMTEALSFLSSIFSASLFDVSGCIISLKGLNFTRIIPSIVIMIIVEWVKRGKQHAFQFSGKTIVTRYIVFRYILYIVMMILIIISSDSQSEFIYFQF